jgi:pimeloyl-ACP methyl ester carboxylesterase
METVTSADGTVIAFDQLGSGTPLVLVAGASCDRGADAAHATALAASFTVLNFDRRGRGDSTDTSPYAVQREVEDLAVLLDAAGGGATVVGLSSGAALAAHAVAKGVPATHLVLWEPPFRLDPAGQQAAREYAETLSSLLVEDRRDDALELFMRMVGVPEPMIEGMRQSPHWAAGEALAPTLAHDAEIMGDAGVPVDVFAAITTPTLVLAGGGSPAWMRESAAATAGSIPGAEVGVLAGQAHDVDASVLAGVVHAFVERTSVESRR